MAKLKFAGTFAALVLMSKSVLAAQTLEYTILKEGEPIGHENVVIDMDGDKTIVDVETETHVKVLFLNFNYEHKRKETWLSNELVSMQSKTNDDGSPHTYNLTRQGDVLALNVDGKDVSADKDALPLTLWGKAALNRKVLLSVIDAQPYKVETTQLGENHYKVSGDIERELWFSKDGYLEKAAFKRKGFLIEFLRKTN